MKKTYRVEIEYTYTGVFFDFDNFYDACNFMASALESMTYGEGLEKTGKLTIIDEEVGLNE